MPFSLVFYFQNLKNKKNSKSQNLNSWLTWHGKSSKNSVWSLYFWFLGNKSTSYISYEHVDMFWPWGQHCLLWSVDFIHNILLIYPQTAPRPKTSPAQCHYRRKVQQQKQSQVQRPSNEEIIQLTRWVSTIQVIPSIYMYFTICEENLNRIQFSNVPQNSLICWFKY